MLRTTRIALLVQAVELLAVIGLTVPSTVDYLTRPVDCTTNVICTGFRGLPFELAATFLGPPTVLLVATYWLWRRPRRWPAAFPILVDLAVITVVLIDLVEFARTGSEPYMLLQVLLGLLPAVVSLTLVLLLLRTWGAGTIRRDQLPN